MSTTQSAANPLVVVESPTKPQLTKSINELRGLSTALHNFTLRYDDLQNHLDSIQQSINQFSTGNCLIDSQVDKFPTPADTQLVNSSNPNPNVSNQDDSKMPELDTLCEAMSGKGLRRYIVFNLNNVKKLREEVPKALKLALNPAKMVLEAVGKFFLQGSKAYTKDSPMVSGRTAAILVLEFYLLSECGKVVGVNVEKEAESAAVLWRKRLILEGGVQKASEIDARGLLLFVGSFGIPSAFRRDDVIDLILLCHPREISDALKKSCHLFPKVNEWIPKMIRSGMRVKAVNVAYTFGLDNEIQPQVILNQYLKDSTDSYDRKKRDASDSPQRAVEAADKHLYSLKSVIKCLEYHGIDPSKFLPDWQIKEMIVKVEKDLVQYEKEAEAKALQKREEELEVCKKRPRYTNEVSFIPTHLSALHERSVVAQVDRYDPYDLGRGYVRSYTPIRDEIVVDKFGQIVDLKDQPHGYKLVNTAYDERLAVAQAISSKYAVADRYSLFGASSLEGFPGLQVNQSSAPGASTSIVDRYQFADSVAGHSHYGSISQQPGAGSTSARVIPDQHTSYYYQ